MIWILAILLIAGLVWLLLAGDRAGEICPLNNRRWYTAHVLQPMIGVCGRARKKWT